MDVGFQRRWGAKAKGGHQINISLISPRNA